MGTPVITIYVRHGFTNGNPCKYTGDEFSRRCNCPKHFRWTQSGTQYRQKAGTRSWESAEEKKRQLQDQLAGRTPETRPEDNARTVQSAIDVFLQDKRVQGITAGVLGKYTRELARLRDYCERQSIFTVQAITRELLTGFCATWEAAYPSSYTRAKVRERLRSFLRYGFEAKWLDRIPALPKIKVEEPPTLPLSAAEYKRLLDTVYGQISDRKQADRVHALFQLMRHSGLAIRDALTLERNEIQHDAKKGLYRIVTARQKTGTNVSVPIPPEIAKELLAVINGNERYVFWSGNGEEESVTKNWAKYYIAPVFKAAGVTGEGHMMSHRLRDTFAVDLLGKGVPLEEVSKLLGHESINTTEKHYAKWVEGRQDRLDALVTATWMKSKTGTPAKRTQFAQSVPR
jgi:integrase/recombinase XerD